MRSGPKRSEAPEIVYSKTWYEAVYYTPWYKLVESCYKSVFQFDVVEKLHIGSEPVRTAYCIFLGANDGKMPDIRKPDIAKDLRNLTLKCEIEHLQREIRKDAETLRWKQDCLAGLQKRKEAEKAEKASASASASAE